MIEYMLSFSLGYFFARLIQYRPKADMLLYWDGATFGWRPVVNSKSVDPHGRYLAAFEVDPKSFSPEIEDESR